jgi:hypothetical protein
MTKITLDEFQQLMNEVRQLLFDHKTLRLGQTIFNRFAAEKRIAEMQRGTKNDCFYNNSKITLFFQNVLDDEALEFYCKSNLYQFLNK